MLPEDWQIKNPSICRNCGGIGEIIIETITGGPKTSPMRVDPTSGETTTYIDEKWYKRKLECYLCVVCNGVGKSAVKQEQVKELHL